MSTGSFGTLPMGSSSSLLPSLDGLEQQASRLPLVNYLKNKVVRVLGLVIVLLVVLLIVLAVLAVPGMPWGGRLRWVKHEHMVVEGFDPFGTGLRYAAETDHTGAGSSGTNALSTRWGDKFDNMINADGSSREHFTMEGLDDAPAEGLDDAPVEGFDDAAEGFGMHDLPVTAYWQPPAILNAYQDSAANFRTNELGSVGALGGGLSQEWLKKHASGNAKAAKENATKAMRSSDSPLAKKAAVAAATAASSAAAATKTSDPVLQANLQQKAAAASTVASVALQQLKSTDPSSVPSTLQTAVGQAAAATQSAIAVSGGKTSESSLASIAHK